MARYSQTAAKLLPHLLQEMSQAEPVVIAQAGGSGSLTAHAIDGAYHTGTLATSQAPWAVTATTFATHEANTEAHHATATAGNGISITGQQISLASSAAGAGLTYTTGVLAVGAGTLLTVAADSIGVSAGSAYQFIGTGSDTGAEWRNVSELAGSGLTAATGVLAVGVSGLGLGVGADAVTLTSSSDPGAAAAILATASDGSLTLDTNLLAVDAAGNVVGVGRTPDGAATLDVQALANGDHSVRITQKSGQTGRLWRIEDTAGGELIVLDSVGNLQSGNPGFVSGLTGWQITPTGNAEFNNVWVRGELHASIFVMDEFHSNGGTFVTATAGKLENDAVLSSASDAALTNVRTTAFSDQTYLDYRTTSGTGSGTGITARSIENWIEITDPPSGHATIFQPGHIVRCKTFTGSAVYDLWMRVNSATDLTDYYRYHVQVMSGTYTTLPAGSAVIRYGNEGDGLILQTADLQYAPYLDIFTVGAEPWNGDITPHVRLGRLDGVGVPGVSGIEQYGIIGGTNLSDANTPYFVMSDLQQKLYRIDSEWHDGTNPTVRIESDGNVAIGTDVDNAATTALSFDPVTGNLTIGNASYPGSVTVYGTIYLPGGTPVQTMTWRGAWVSGTAYAVQDAVSYNSKSWINDTAHTASAGNAPGTGAMWDLLADQGAAGADGADNQDFAFLEANAADMTGKPAGAYHVAEYIGFWSGTAFTAYIDNAGDFRFGSGSGSAKLEYSASAGKLRGVNSSGIEQWYAQASDGKLYAAEGRLVMDSDGIALNPTQSDGTFNINRGYRFVNDYGMPIAGYNDKYADSTDPETYIYNNVDFEDYSYTGSTKELLASRSASLWVDVCGHTLSAGETGIIQLRASHRHISGGIYNTAAILRLYASSSEAYVSATGIMNFRSTAIT